MALEKGNTFLPIMTLSILGETVCIEEALTNAYYLTEYFDDLESKSSTKFPEIPY